MNPLLNARNLLIGLLCVLVVGLVIYGVHSIRVADFDRGAASVQKKWDEYQDKQDKEILVLKGQLLHKEEVHKDETRKISNELAEAEKNHVAVVVALTSDYQHRLLVSADRAAFFERQAKAGTLECGSLASHAGRLDASLEEGRQLVAELRSTLELRDTQVKALGEQIRSDRKLFE